MRGLERFLLTIVAVLAVGGCKKRQPAPPPVKSHLQQADLLRRQGKVDEAIAEYRTYIDLRLKEADRSSQEDPNFFLIVAGDLLLDTQRPVEAYDMYKEAEMKGVDKPLVADRYLHLAEWYSHGGKFDEAIAILRRHSFLDPATFEGHLDQVERRRISHRGLLSPTPPPHKPTRPTPSGR